MDPLSTTFSALADPTRRAILTQLMEQPTSVGALADPFDISLPAVSRHLKVLERADLITRKRDGQTITCHLNAPALRSATEWLEHYARFWQGSFDRLEDHFNKTTSDPSGKGAE